MCFSVVTCCVRMFFFQTHCILFLFWVIINQHNSPSCHCDKFLPQELYGMEGGAIGATSTLTLTFYRLSRNNIGSTDEMSLDKEANCYFSSLVPQDCWTWSTVVGLNLANVTVNESSGIFLGVLWPQCDSLHSAVVVLKCPEGDLLSYSTLISL